MKLFIGLGNPEDKYIDTKHNVGFVVVGKIDQIYSDNHSNAKIIFAKSESYMNSSGDAVKKLVDYYKINMDNLYVIHDDLDIRLGEYKIQKGKGPKDHNGIISVENRLKDNDFWRIRVGIENRDTNNHVSGEEYVLQKFTKEEQEIIINIAEKITNDIKKRLH